MPFVDEILKYKSLSVVGLEKNTGKTECLNYILRRLEHSGRRLALTSIGVDGEKTDRVTGTAKPETDLYNEVIFITSEKHYRQKSIHSEILDISTRSTALGRLVTARALSRGKVMFSGPADTLWLKDVINQMKQYNVELTMVDGAISRLSPGSPAVTESMILNTGAAVSANINRLISHTKFVYDLIRIPEMLFDQKNISNDLESGNDKLKLRDKLLSLYSGVYALDDELNLYDLKIPSVFLLKDADERLFRHGNIIYVTGAVSDRMLEFIRLQKEFKYATLVIRDFTRLFVKPETYRSFIHSGHKIRVLLHTKLLAVCVNPVSPQGYILNSEELCAGLSETLKIPVYDIKRQQP